MLPVIIGKIVKAIFYSTPKIPKAVPIILCFTTNVTEGIRIAE
jgi:hypothetical protein